MLRQHSSIEDADGVPTTDERTYKAGTLVVETREMQTVPSSPPGRARVEVHYPGVRPTQLLGP